MLMMAPLPRAAMAGASSATRTKGTLTLTAKAASMFSFANFRGRTHGEDGGVVDQDVHVAAAEFDGPASERSCRVSAAKIGGNEVCFAALGLDRGDDRVATRGVTATDEHMGAPIGQREGGGFADAAGSGDQGRGTCEVSGAHEVALLDF